MYLKSLELQGFKSFPDKIKLDFNKGITAVVGPNGSGKSNIGDAVRWVLGEQSSKSLRGAKMEDVIFAGTQFRKPMGFAQVTLEIANDDKTLGIDSDLAAVTRKLYRSGESEYLINGKPCRLKDVTELFMDTGMGKDGYSIIGQGRIAEIVSAKSGERRDIFEEAAGISKLRYKKAEAERKLSQAQENILRLKDIVTELEKRVGPLKAQSEKAAEFLGLSERKKTAEITVWTDQLDKLKASLADIEEKILINTAEYDSTDAESEQGEARMQELTRDMQDNAVRIEELRSRIREYEQSETKLHSEIAVCENEIRHCEENIEEYERQQQNAETYNAETAGEIQAELDKIKASETELDGKKARCAAAEEELRRIVSDQENQDSSIEKQSSALNALYITKSQYEAAAENGKTGSEDLLRQLELGNSQTQTLQETLISLDAEEKEVNASFSVLDTAADEHKNRLSGLEKLFGSKTSAMNEIRQNIDENVLKLRDIDRKISFLTGLEDSMAGFDNAVKQVFRASGSGVLRGILGSVSQLITTENRFSTAIETVLGKALQNIIVSDETAAKDAIAYLKKNNAGRATFLPLTSVKGKRLEENGLDDQYGFVSLAADAVRSDPKYTGIVNSLLGRIVIAEDINCANDIARRYGFRFRIVTLDGQLINAGGSFTGGSAVRSTGVLTRKTEIDELSSEKEKINGSLSSMREKFDRLKAETDKFSFDIEDAKEKIKVTEQDRIRFEAELQRISAVREQTKNQLANSSGQENIILRRIEELKKAAVSAEENLAKINEQITAAEKSISLDNEKKEKLRAHREELSAEISAIKIREAEIAKEIENSRSSIERIEEKRRLLGDDTARLTVMIEDQKRIADEKSKRIDECRELLTGSREKTASLNDSIYEVQAVSRDKEQEAANLRRKSRELSDIKEKLTAERTRLEERRSGVQNEYDGIIGDMEEQYEIYPSEARKIAMSDADIPAVKKELAEIKQKIRSLGNVNLSAIEEYKEVSEQYEFMSGELDDVEKSRDKLEGIIKDLTETMKQQFSECFGRINENFRQVFVELFGGGKSELALSDPNDVLNSGIEIYAAPPGKVIKSLSLLSGGEQALVAIALYFAILMIKPAPFCILDEIEAALDDVNVSRYAKYLRHFTDTTQFITVTHRRGTMEEADVMYGVTMQQKGISRLLKLEQPPAEDVS